MTLAHLEKLKQLEPGNINDIHKYLCNSRDDDLVEISSIITNLYEIAESERELKEREKHGIDEKTYPENAEWRRSFFVNPNPNNVKNNKVELEYFLNLLYSFSFTLCLARKNRNDFDIQKTSHLAQLEYFLNTLENLYIALDTLAVLIYLTCGLNKRVRDIYFTTLKEDLESTHHYASNFNRGMFDVTGYPLNMLNKIRNMRAHKPFLDWNNYGKIVSKPENLSKVKSVCDRDGLFDKDINEFINECFKETTNILKISLGGILKTYKQRLSNNEVSQPHGIWEKSLAGQ